MQPSIFISLGKRNFVLVFEDVREGDSFLQVDPFTQDSDIVLARHDGVKFDIDYTNREDLSDFISGLSATNSKVMKFHATFELLDMPEMKKAFLCSWQHMYYLVLFTSYNEPFQIMIDTRRNEKDSIDSMKELSEDFLRESYGNHGIKLNPIAHENE